MPQQKSAQRSWWIQKFSLKRHQNVRSITESVHKQIIQQIFEIFFVGCWKDTVIIKVVTEHLTRQEEFRLYSVARVQFCVCVCVCFLKFQKL